VLYYNVHVCPRGKVGSWSAVRLWTSRVSKHKLPLSKMDLPMIGSHCALQSCNDLDLLPIRCQCEKLFCRQHIAADSHDCPIATSTHSNYSHFEKLQRCSLENCSKPSLESFNGANSLDHKASLACSLCHLSFCVQ
jgi:AN1-like Zinc finger